MEVSDDRVVGRHYVGIVHREFFSDDPRECMGFLGRFYIPSNEFISSDCSQEEFENFCVRLPVYALSHSRVTINTTGFNDPWDSGQLGWIGCTWDDIVDMYKGTEYLVSDKYEDGMNAEVYDQVSNILLKEVEVMDRWLTGEVYGFTIHWLSEDPTDEPYNMDTPEDSCWGFYGLDVCRDNMATVVEEFDRHFEEGVE